MLPRRQDQNALHRTDAAVLQCPASRRETQETMTPRRELPSRPKCSRRRLRPARLCSDMRIVERSCPPELTTTPRFVRHYRPDCPARLLPDTQVEIRRAE